MATWGVKLDETLKEKLTNAMRESGLEGQDFIEQLYTLYAAEAIKQEKPQLAGELEELQKLTQRIYGIYLNSAERNDNLIQAKEDSFQASLKELHEQGITLKAELINREADFLSLQESYNTLSEDKTEVDVRIAELIDTIATKQELVIEYKEKNDTLTGLINEYKAYREENKGLIESLKNLEAEVSNIKLALKETQSTISLKEQEIERINKVNAAALITQQTNHNKEIENLKSTLELEKGTSLLQADQKHQKLIGDLTEKFNMKLETANDKLEVQREMNIKLQEENITIKAATQKKEPRTAKAVTTKKD